MLSSILTHNFTYIHAYLHTPYIHTSYNVDNMNTSIQNLQYIQNVYNSLEY